MKKIFTLFSASLCSLAALAGTPTLDGSYSPTEGWGAAVATGDGVAGWADANARTLYVTTDANYVYFGAECTAQSWQQFIFVVNTQSGGGRTDAWGRQITYNHTNAPDFIFRGDLSGSNYMEFHVWDGTAWTGTGTNRNASGNEAKGIFTNTSAGFIEIRVPRSVIGANVTVADVQFVIGGDQGSHGNFDAVPNDNNGTSWSAPGNFTTISNYRTAVALPITLSSFTAQLQRNNIQLAWATSTELNAANFEVQKLVNNTWVTLGTVAARNAAAGASYSFTDVNIANINQYRLRMVSRDGNFTLSRTLTIQGTPKSAITVFPTLVEGNTVNITIPSLVADKVGIQVFSTTGKLVATNQLTVQAGTTTVQQVLPASLPAGQYKLRVVGNATSADFTIVKQ
ncbi:MAG: hypothetical protein EAZ47_05985 [Bacteroidetes bacterium]|nr:MAG: hypothetical protein EAY72_04490 [Bacteroidota bacterium]TAF93606.1 MAG: hypothetical protein EAZ47_05985 [Bacteroidota bacterium]